MNITGPSNDLVALTLQLTQLGNFDGAIQPISLPGLGGVPGAVVPVVVESGAGAQQIPIYTTNQSTQSFPTADLPAGPALNVQMALELNQCINETNRYANSL